MLTVHVQKCDEFDSARTWHARPSNHGVNPTETRLYPPLQLKCPPLHASNLKPWSRLLGPDAGMPR